MNPNKEKKINMNTGGREGGNLGPFMFSGAAYQSSS